ncbi:MAG: hypothetical protein KKF98_12510 [Bacteroidetes bacterium]|nr:hypothetical protein [Bacteroidota bacterium]
MKNFLKIFLVTLVIFTPSLFSQITLQAGGGVGLVMPAGDFGGTTQDFYNGTAYGLSNGLNLHGKVRAGVLGFTLVGELGYVSLENSGVATNDNKGKVKVKTKIFSVKIGPEVSFSVPALPLKPYIGGNLSLNNFSGDFRIQGMTKVPADKFTIQSTSRIGFGLNGGVMFKLNELMSIDVALQYNMMNVYGKEYRDRNPLKEQPVDAYLALNDDKDPLYRIANEDHFISKSRTINSLVLSVSLMLGL